MQANGKIVLLAVGDIMLGDTPHSYGFGVGSQIKKHGPLFPFEGCAKELRRGDIVFGNLEVVLSRFNSSKDPFDEIVLRAQPESAAGLSAAGFNVLSLANNHIMQHGKTAIEETLDILEARNILSIGMNLPERGVTNSAVVEKGNIRIGFLGYNMRPLQYFKDPPLYVEGNPEAIRRDILSLKGSCDLVVVSLHWGDEFVDHPSAEQVGLARSFIDAGAKVILGHHPHILQGIEKYKGGVIAYSLGNFVFDFWQWRLRDSMILRIEIGKDSGVDFDIIPVRINQKHQPIIIDPKDGSDIKNHVEQISRKIEEAIGGAEYRDIVTKATRDYRRQVYRHYLLNIHRYDPGLLMRNFYGVVKRRITRRGNRRSADFGAKI